MNTPDLQNEEWQVWGNPGEMDLAVGPKSGGVAICQIVTVNGIGIMTKETSERGAHVARLIALTPRLLAMAIRWAQAGDAQAIATVEEWRGKTPPTIYNQIAKHLRNEAYEATSEFPGFVTIQHGPHAVLIVGNANEEWQIEHFPSGDLADQPRDVWTLSGFGKTFDDAEALAVAIDAMIREQLN